MGQSRLSIIDLEGGRQPLYSHDRKLVLIANGEIYNFVELRRDLERMGHQFLTASDSEVILHCYEEYGDDFLKHLNGMFAFALFDNSRNRLILARDRIGIKPLFFAQRPGGVIFASEIKALLPLLDRTPSIDPNGLIQYLQNQFSSGRTTILKEVERVLPGEAVRVEMGAVTKRWTYWSALDVVERGYDLHEAQRQFDQIMEDVMVEHMRSDVPFGLFLSGGVDSAVLLAMLSMYQDEPVRTFSVGFPGTRLDDELPMAQAMAGRFSTRHTEIALGKDEVFNIMPLTVWAADELMHDYANLPTCLLSRAASNELKVVFSGEGGDEVFAGYGRYRASRFEQWFKSLLIPGTGGFRTRGNFRRRWPGKLFGQQLQSASIEARRPFIENWSRTPDNWSRLQKMQYTDLVTAIPDNLLVKADRMMMAWGLEGRVPFLDHRIVEFGLSLPDNLKIKPGQGKLFLKRWASKYIPEEHLQTPKKGFHVPIGEWVSEPFLRELGQILPNLDAIEQWFVPSGISRLISSCRSSPSLNRMLWAIMQFAVWYRLFIEGDGEKPPESINPLELLN
jgi:asparagine synthase (glutamine-hydrolysing)